jgi:hypothetical protein
MIEQFYPGYAGYAESEDAIGSPEITGLVPRPSLPRFYLYAEVAKMFGRTPRTVRWWVKAGRIKAIYMGQVSLRLLNA